MSKPRLLTLQELVDHPVVIGVALGACVDGSGWDGRHRAHAHSHSRDGSETHEGWICIERPADADGELLLEELAHLIAKTEGAHDATYHATVHGLRKLYRTK